MKKTGAKFIVDLIGRVVIAPYELPIELIVGIFGSLLFIMLLLYRLKHGRKAIHFTRRGENKTCIMEGGTSL